MSLITKQSFLIPKGDGNGNVSIFSPDIAGTPLYGKVRGKGKLSVKEGQLVFWDPATNTTIAPGDTPNKFNISVACKNAQGKLELAHAAFGDHGYNTCNLTHANTSLPNCGQGPIKDVYFDCVGCGDTVSLTIGWDNQETRDQFPEFRFAEETFSVTVPCEKCVDCPTDDTTCEHFVDKLVTRINEGNTYRYDFGLIDGVNKGYTSTSPWSAHRIFGETYTFCGSITPTQGCDGKCCCLTTLDSIEIPGLLGKDGTAPVFEFNQELDFQDPEITYTYLKDFKAEFDDFYQGKAFIHFAMGVGTCCPYKVYLDVCPDAGEPIVTFDGEALPLGIAYDSTLDKTSDDFDKEAYDAATTDKDTGKKTDLCMRLPGCGLSETTPGFLSCETCERTEVTKDWKCGIRVYLDPVKLECGECNFPALPYKWYYGSSLELRVNGAGEWTTVDRQLASMPRNTGYQIQQLELTQETYGDYARTYASTYRKNRGPVGLPQKDSRLRSLKTDCSKTYCILHLGGRNVFHGSNGISEGGRSNKVNTTIAFESSLNTDKFFEYLNPLITKDCCSLKAIHCTPDNVDTIHGDGTGNTPSNITSNLTH